MPTTLAALGVAILAILPGAVFTFAYESKVGAFGTSLPDRTIRFLSASAIFHALTIGLTYQLYRTEVRTGHLAAGLARIWVVQVFSLAYIGVPIAAGFLAGHGKKNHWPIFRRLAVNTPEPRAWDFFFGQEPAALLCMKMKSGKWLAGVFGKADDQDRSYASCHPEEGDIYLPRAVKIDHDTGELIADENGCAAEEMHGLLVRWNEIEYAKIIRKDLNVD